MPTTKSRINLTVPMNINRAIIWLASRDHVSVATKTLDLVQRAMEIEEDAALLHLAEARERVKGKLVSHRDVWV